MGLLFLSNQLPMYFDWNIIPLTFEVIIDGFVLIAILLLVFWLFL